MGWVGQSLRETWGGVGQFHLANVDLELAMWEEVSTQVKWCLSVDCTRGGPKKEQWWLSLYSSLCSNATQLSVFLYVSCTYQAADPPLELRMNVYR